MKKLIFGISVVILAACQQQNIAFVDNVKLMDGYQEKLDVEARYKTRTDALNKKRDSISQAFQLDAQEFQARAQSMSQKKAQEEYDLLQQRGQFIGQQLQQEEQLLQQQGQVEMDSVVSNVKAAIQKYGKENGYTYILGGGDGGSVLYGAEANDITDAILEILNKEYGKE